MKTYKEYRITTEPFIPEILSGLLWELNISGLSEEDNCIKIFSETGTLSLQEIEKFLKKLTEQKLIDNFTIDESEIENKNWNEEWEKNLNIIKVTDKLVIKPSTKEYSPEKVEIVITIDPKMSFGTGEHQTTKLMLRMIEKYTKPVMNVLDVGSGTAVLAIAAVKLGAQKAIAVDNDELCFANGIENIILNNASEQVEVRIGEIKDVPENNFDMILANIQKDVILSIAEDVKSKLNRNGMVILSGLLKEDEEEVVSNYNMMGFKLIEKESMDEWITLVFNKG